MRDFAADRVVAARLSDTGDTATFVLAAEDGGEATVTLPVHQLAPLVAAAQSLAGRLAGAADSTGGGPAPSSAPMAVERWAVRPEPDEEHVVLGFRLAKGMHISLRLHRTAAQAFARALSSLLGRYTPAPPSSARH